MSIKYESKDLEANKEAILNILTSKGVKEAENEVTRQLNNENLNRGVNGLPQNARTTNPKYKAMLEVIENYKEALNDKDELFKQFVLYQKEFKEWLSKKK